MKRGPFQLKSCDVGRKIFLLPPPLPPPPPLGESNGVNFIFTQAAWRKKHVQGGGAIRLYVKDYTCNCVCNLFFLKSANKRIMASRQFFSIIDKSTVLVSPRADLRNINS